MLGAPRHALVGAGMGVGVGVVCSGSAEYIGKLAYVLLILV